MIRANVTNESNPIHWFEQDQTSGFVSKQISDSEASLVDSTTLLLPHPPRPLLLDQKPDPITRRRGETPRQYLHRCHESTNLVDILVCGEDWMDRDMELGQSQVLIMAIIETALQSMTATNTSTLFTAPILLLDEWLDKETSTVIQTVQASLQRLVNATGAVVICVTHVPDRFETANCRRIQLQSGRLLSFT